MRVLFLLLTSCALTTSFDYDTVDRPQPAARAVRGTVTGVEDAKVTLRLNGGGDLVVGNGDFAFASGVADGASYVVTADAPDHVCSVENGSGNIAGADITVVVKCASSNADLAALGLSHGTLVPAFDPKTMAYTASVKTSKILFPAASVGVVATPKSANATVSIAPAMPVSIPVGPSSIDVTVTAADKTTVKHYTIAVTGRVADYIKASNTHAQYGFGQAIAFDGNTLAVGELDASNAKGIGGDPTDTSMPFAGSVHVYTRTDGVWSQQAYIKASNTRKDGTFGEAVALSGNTLAVGAPCESSNATGINGDQNDASLDCAGAVYVFVRNGTTWTQQAYIKPSDTSATSRFGNAVALAGDTLVVGAPHVIAPIGCGAGAAYVFERSNGVWSQTAAMGPSQAAIQLAYDYGFDIWYGQAVAVSADAKTVAIGSSYEDGMGTVHVFGKSNAKWTETDTIPNPELGDWFGQSLSLSANGDTMAVGAPAGNGGKGGAWIYVRNGTYAKQAKIQPSNPGNQFVFGYVSLSASGDLLAVGSPEEPSAATGINGDQTNIASKNAGAVYVYDRSGSTWTQRAYVKATNADSGPGLFGQALAITPDTLIVGAWYEGSTATGFNGDQTISSAPIAGAVFVY